MSRISVPSVTVVHYVDPICPWSLGLETPLNQVKNLYGDKLKVEYRAPVAVPDIRSLMRQNEFDHDIITKFHLQIARKIHTGFDPDYVRKICLKSSLPACLAFKAAQMQNEELSRTYLRRVMETFLVEPVPFSEEALFRVARDSGLDERRLPSDMHSKKTRDRLRKDMEAIQKDRVTLLDLVVVTAEGQSEEIKEAFRATSVEGNR